MQGIETNSGTVCIRMQDLTGEYVETCVDLDKVERVSDQAEEAVERFQLVYEPIQQSFVPHVRMLSGNAQSQYQNIRFVQRFARSRDAQTKEPLYPITSLSTEVAEQGLQTTLEAWKDTEACRFILGLLKSKEHLKVKSVVAFGNGSLADTTTTSAFGTHVDEARFRENSRYQHALMLTVGELYDTKNESGSSVQYYAQEPRSQEIDRAVLGTWNITVVDDPEGFLRVDDESVVISIHSAIPLRQIVCEIAKPAVLIWNTVDGPEAPRACLDSDSPRLWSFIQEYYDHHSLPEDFPTHSVSIYTRKEHWDAEIGLDAV